MKTRIRDGGVGGSQPLRVIEHIQQAEGHHPHHVRAERQQEQEEVTVVAASNAVVDPGAVMVKVLAGAVCQNAWRVGPGHGDWCGEGQGGHLHTVVTDAAV